MRNAQRTKIQRYLLIIFLTKSTQTFRLSGKEIDNAVYFDLSELCRFADSSSGLMPRHFAAIQFNTKDAITIYTMLAKTRLVSIKKMGGVPYVTTTEKGDDVSTQSS